MGGVGAARPGSSIRWGSLSGLGAGHGVGEVGVGVTSK